MARTPARAARSADKIYIRNGAQFVGDIQALGIVIEDGGFLCGRLELLRQSSVSKDTD
jgi:cytoskeletal protein CcmA (bactofilin family)